MGGSSQPWPRMRERAPYGHRRRPQRGAESFGARDRSGPKGLLGGDEFAVLVEGAPGPEDAERVTRRILERLKDHFDIGGREVFTSANVGVAPAATGQEDAAKLLRNADLAMYGSKKSGKGGYKVFEAGEDDSVLTSPELGGGLRGG